MNFPDNLLALLPAPSREKLENLLVERDAARDAYRAASDREQEARQEAGLAEARARERLEMAPGIPGDVAAIEAEIRTAGAQHPAGAVIAARNAKPASRWREAVADDREAIITAPAEAAKRRHQLALDARERAAERQSSFAYLEDVQRWLERAVGFGGMRLEHHAVAAPKVRDPAVEIAKLRSELVTLDDAWTSAENAPVPSEVLRAMAIAEIDAVAQKGALSLDPLSRAGNPLGLAGAIKIASVPVMVPGDDRPTMMLRGDGGGALFAWLMRDALVAKVDDLLAALPKAGSLSDDEREAEFRRVSVRRLEIERQEEALVVAAEREGRVITRRRDLDPRALLEVVEV